MTGLGFPSNQQMLLNGTLGCKTHGDHRIAIEIIVHPGVDKRLHRMAAPFIDQCRGFALKRKVKRAPGSAVSPNTTSEPDARDFVEEIVASWVGFANGPDVDHSTRRPTTEWPIQK